MATNIDRETVQQLLKEIDDLLAMRQGFAAEYRKWRPEAIRRVEKACGADAASEFERLGPQEIPINRQHRVHVYRQTLTAQARYLTRLLEETEQAETAEQAKG